MEQQLQECLLKILQGFAALLTGEKRIVRTETPNGRTWKVE